MILFGKRKVYALMQVFNMGTYGERVDVCYVFRRERDALKWKKELEQDNEFKDRKYKVESWPLK